MTCWPVSSGVFEDPREKRVKSAVRAEEDGKKTQKTSGSMFTWLLRDPQRVRVGIVNVQPSGHQCSSAVAGEKGF